MAQHDYVIANQSGSSFRSDLNNALSAIVSQNSGSSEPSTTYAYQTWADTTAGVMKMRNGANSAWITLYQLDGEWSTIAFENGTAAAPSIYFKDSGTDTGFYSPGANQVGISTGGTARLTIDSSGNVDIDSNTLYVDATNNRVGLGTSSPGYLLEANSGATDATALFNSTAATGSHIRFGRSGTVDGYLGCATGFLTSGTSAGDVGIRSQGAFVIGTGGNNNRLFINSTGAVGIGTTSGVGYRKLTLKNDGSAGGIAVTNTNDDIVGQFCGENVGTSQELGIYSLSNMRLYTGGFMRATVDTSGRFLVGTSSAFDTANTGTNWLAGIEKPSGYSALSIKTNEASANGAYLNLGKSRGTTANSKTIVNNNDELGGIYFEGADGASMRIGAIVSAFVDGTPGANDMPGRLVFSTTADGASSPTERARITNKGGLWAGTTTRIDTDNHTFVAQSQSDWIAQFQNGGASVPLGVYINYSGASPNGTGSNFLRCDDTTTTRATIRSNGGLANYSANNVNLSDRNVKKDIAPAAGTWDCLKEWEIINFRYRDQPDDADLNLGVIAQQVAESCPEVIQVFQEAKEATETEPAQEKRIGVKEQQMMWMAIKALQEAQLRIETLEAEVAALKS